MAMIAATGTGERGHPLKGLMSEEIRSIADLIRYFSEGAKAREDWRIGTEYEKVAVFADSGYAIPFSGPRGAEEILRRLADRYGYQPEEEEGRILALKAPNSSITLEPGGQIELSGEQCVDIHCAYAEFSQHGAQLREVASGLDVALLGLGMQPRSRLDQIELLPKTRYRIMYPYMARRGGLGQRMMKQTAGVQANLDYSDEADAMRKLRVAMGIVPLLYAIFANSPLSDGGLNGYLSFRGRVWLDTDPDRCGIPPFVFNEQAGFEDYAQYALDVPMYFIIRDHRYLDLTRPPGLSFRQFLDLGFEGARATMEDWANHLTTIFTEARLKRYLELRTPDSQPPALMLAFPALCKGLLYDLDCTLAAWDLVKRWSPEQRWALTTLAHKAGLETRLAGIRLRDLALELLEIAMSGLSRQGALNARGDNESIYLLRTLDLVRGGHNPASLVVGRWKGPWNYDFGRLVAGTSYDNEEWA